MGPTNSSLKRKSSVGGLTPAKKARKSHVGVPLLHVQNNGLGSVAVFGDGSYGQLGLGLDVTEKLTPAIVPGLCNIIHVAAGGMHTVVLNSDYKVITFGCNDLGALGRDTHVKGSAATPGLVNVPAKVVQISAGNSHTAVLTDTGVVYIWGIFRDSLGAMGLHHNEIEKYPTIVETKMKLKKIASGADHLVLLGMDGKVYTCGCGEDGQLGRLSKRFSNRLSRTSLGKLYSWGMASIMLGHGYDNDKFIPTLVRGEPFEENNIIQVAAGDSHTVTLIKN